MDEEVRLANKVVCRSYIVSFKSLTFTRFSVRDFDKTSRAAVVKRDILIALIDKSRGELIRS